MDALLREDLQRKECGKLRKMQRRTRNRKLAIWSALPPYLGGKRRLCPLIFREVDRLVQRRHWREMTFLDGFLGGGSVSLYAKAQGFRVVATDIAERAIAVGQALIENSRVRLTYQDVLLSIPTIPIACSGRFRSPIPIIPITHRSGATVFNLPIDAS